MHEVGIRGRFSYGYLQGQPPTEPMNLADLAVLNSNWKSYSAEGLLTLGVAWRGIAASNNTMDTAVTTNEFQTARRLGLPLTIHATPRNKDQISKLAAGGMLGKDVQVVHATDAPAAERVPDRSALPAVEPPPTTVPSTAVSAGAILQNVRIVPPSRIPNCAATTGQLSPLSRERRPYATRSNSNRDATIAAMRGSSDHRRSRVARGQSECGSFTSTKARTHSAKYSSHALAA